MSWKIQVWDLLSLVGDHAFISMGGEKWPWVSLGSFWTPTKFHTIGNFPKQEEFGSVSGNKCPLGHLNQCKTWESGVVSWSNLVPLGVMWEWWKSSGRREGPKFCLWPDHSLHIPLYLSLAFSLCSLNSEPTTYYLFSPSSPLESPNTLPRPPTAPFHTRETIIVLGLCSYLKKSGASNSGCWEISSP